MQDQSDVRAAFPVTVESESHMADYCVGSAFCDQIDRSFQIDQSGDRSAGYAVVHWNDDGRSGVSFHDSFESDLFSSHCFLLRGFFIQVIW